MRAYHDREWGRPVTDDRRLFEKLCLEGFQAGLSWATILRKREAFRRAFFDFEPEKVARLGPRRIEALLQDASIVRHRGKIESTVNNARRVLELREEKGSLAAHVWSFEPARPRSRRSARVAARTTSPEAVALAADLKRRGWTFVGPTTVYAFFQAMGLVNDHVLACPFGEEVEVLRRRLRRPRT